MKINLVWDEFDLGKSNKENFYSLYNFITAHIQQCNLSIEVNRTLYDLLETSTSAKTFYVAFRSRFEDEKSFEDWVDSIPFYITSCHGKWGITLNKDLDENVLVFTEK